MEGAVAALLWVDTFDRTASDLESRPGLVGDVAGRVVDGGGLTGEWCSRMANHHRPVLFISPPLGSPSTCPAGGAFGDGGGRVLVVVAVLQQDCLTTFPNGSHPGWDRQGEAVAANAAGRGEDVRPERELSLKTADAVAACEELEHRYQHYHDP